MFNSHPAYILIAALFSIGFYGLISSANLFKKIISLSILQNSIILMYICVGYKGSNAISPIYKKVDLLYTNPIPQVLMLTAIVVGLATSSVGLALILKINKSFNSVNSEDIDKKCQQNLLVVKKIQSDKEDN